MHASYKRKRVVTAVISLHWLTEGQRHRSLAESGDSASSRSPRHGAMAQGVGGSKRLGVRTSNLLAPAGNSRHGGSMAALRGTDPAGDVASALSDAQAAPNGHKHLEPTPLLAPEAA